MKNNFNNWVSSEKLNEWHKVDKENFTPPPTNYNLLFFTKAGDIFCGEYKGSRGFICYGIGKKELTDVEVTHWRIVDFPIEYQEMLDAMDASASGQTGT